MTYASSRLKRLIPPRLSRSGASGSFNAVGRSLHPRFFGDFEDEEENEDDDEGPGTSPGGFGRRALTMLPAEEEKDFFTDSKYGVN